MEDQPKTKFPSPQEFFIKIPLYADYSFNERMQIFGIEFFQDTIDTYCVECNKESVFKSDIEMPQVIPPNGSGWFRPNSVEDIISSVNILNEERHKLFWPQNLLNPGTPKTSEYFPSNRFFIARFHCTRIKSHHIYFCFIVNNSALTKIGQYPSMADIESAGLQKYRKVLSDEKFRELNRAIGLTTHGVGIGAFVYLRRIFEDLIEEARVTASSSEASWDNDKFEKAHIDEKIFLLKPYLPGFLIENRKLYGILSMGIHELTEDECLKYFTVVRLAIELILDEKLKKKETEIKVSEASEALTKIKTQLKNK